MKQQDSQDFIVKSDSISRNSPSVRRREATAKDAAKSTFYVSSPQVGPKTHQGVGGTSGGGVSDSIYVNFSPDSGRPLPGIESPLGRGIEGIFGKPRGENIATIMTNIYMHSCILEYGKFSWLEIFML